MWKMTTENLHISCIHVWSYEKLGITKINKTLKGKIQFRKEKKWNENVLIKL